MNELIDRLHAYRCMEEHFYPEDIVTTKDIWELLDEIVRLHSIIKEVRGKLYDLNYKIKEIHNVPFDVSEIFEIIDLLDKENNNV